MTPGPALPLAVHPSEVVAAGARAAGPAAKYDLSRRNKIIMNFKAVDFRSNSS